MITLSFTDEQIKQISDVSPRLSVEKVVARKVDEVNDVVEASLPGPPNPLVKNNPPSSAKFTLYMDPKEEVAKLVLDDQEFILKAGEWSDWVRVGYRLAPWSTLHGICRFLLVQVHPDLKLYVTPVNIDPEHPAMPISVPADFAGELARRSIRHSIGERGVP